MSKLAKTAALSLFILTLFSVQKSFGWEKLNHITYSGFTGKSITAAWSACPPESVCSDGSYCPISKVCPDNTPCTFCTHPDEYNFQFYNIDMDLVLVMGTTSDTQITVQLPRVGHYALKVQSVKHNCQPVNPADPNSTLVDCKSAWATSLDPKYATVDGVPKSWWIFTWIEPPGGGGVN